MEIICLSGYARSGKDEAAKVLVEEFGFTKIAFADKLREFVEAVDPIVGAGVDRLGESDGDTLLRLSQVFKYHTHNGEPINWENYKETRFAPEIRRLIQRIGTEGGRDTLGKDTWVNAALSDLPEDAKVVVSDGRFANEMDSVRSLGGYVWRIYRPGVGSDNSHSSETEAVNYPNFSLFLQNNGTLSEWRDLVVREYTRGQFREWGVRTTNC